MDKNKTDNSFFPFTPIPNNFIEMYFNNSNASFILIYIYLLKESFNKNFVTLDYLANKFEILQADVLSALKFWEEKNLIYYNLDEKQIINICFLPVHNYNEINTQINNEGLQTNFKIYSQKPSYTPEEINEFYQQEEIKKLLKMVERIFTKTFSYTDRVIIIELYTWLNIPLEVLAVLFTYCVTNNKTSIRYIEKVAIDWAEKGIDTVKKAEHYINIIKNEYKEVLTAFGIKDRELIEDEMNKIKYWLFDLNISLELVKEACKRAVLKTGKVSFKYADKIIDNWYKHGAKNFEDIKRLDNDFEKKNENYVNYKLTSKSIENTTTKYKIQTNKFVNYKQPEYDLKKLKELEYKRLKERANE